MKHLLYAASAMAWVAGVVLAQGWWKLLAFCFPFYGWYLLAEHSMKITGFLP